MMQIVSHTFDNEQKQKIYQEISIGSEPKLPFYVLVTLSTVIAGYGLVANSTAVIIGAMIVAPLMTPIVGISLSLVVNDSALFRHACAAELLGVILAILLGFLVGKLTFGLEIGSEILARTQPSPYDILVALAAGLAGAYTLVNPRLNGALAGVAIAVSLVPPLATCGICLALGHYQLAGNAFLLFFANFLAIQLASIVIFLLFGFTDLSELLDPDPTSYKPASKWHFLYRKYIRHFILSTILLLALTIYLSSTLAKAINERLFHKKLEMTLSTEVQERPGARLSELNYVYTADGKVNAIGVVMTPQAYLPSDVAKLQEKIRSAMDKQINLVIRSLISKDADSHGTIFLLDEEKLKRQQQSEKENLLSTITAIINAELKTVLGAYLVDVKQEESEGIKAMIATVRTPVAIRPDRVALMQEALQKANIDARLVIRSVITRDADATRYLYEATEQEIAKPLATEELALRNQLAGALKEAIKHKIKDASLIDFQYNKNATILNLLAIIQTPKNFSIRQVKALQNWVSKALGREVKLVVRSVVGSDMDENGFVIAVEPF